MPSSGRAILVFAAMSPPQPWECFFCHEHVEFLIDLPGQGGGWKSPSLHHIDGNHYNDDPSNWAWAHGKCHNSFHSSRQTISPEHRAKIAAKVKERMKDPAYRQRISESVRAARMRQTPEERAHSPETRKKISEGNKRNHRVVD